MRIVERLPNEDPKLVRFFEREGFEVYGEAAVRVAAIIFRNSNVGTIGPNQMPVIALTAQQLSVVLRSLLNEHRIEIWAYSNVRNTWTFAVRASPGNFEQIESYMSEDGSGGDTITQPSPIIVSVATRKVNEQVQVGLAFADTTRFILGHAFFIDSDIYSNLENAIVQLAARECIFPNNCNFSEIFEGCGAVASPLQISEFHSQSILSDLVRLTSSDTIIGDEMALETKNAMSGLIKYLGLLSSDDNLGAFCLHQLNLSQFMRLDETALKALNIFPGATGGKATSLLGILDQCKTKQGSKLLDQWLRQPLLLEQEINQRLDLVQSLVENSAVRQNLREYILRGIPDVYRISRKLVKGKATLQDLVLLYFVVGKISPIHEQLSKIEEGKNVDSTLNKCILEPLRRFSLALSNYAELIESTVDFAALNRHEYIVRADFDQSLLSIHQQKEDILNQIEPEFGRVVSDLRLEKGKKIKLERNSTYGYFFRISRLDGALLGSTNEQYQELAALKNGIYFTTSTLRELSFKYDDLGKEYMSAQKVLVEEMLTVATTYRRVFSELNLLISQIDVYQSLAYAAVMSPTPLVRPKILPMGEEMVLEGARHPCVESCSPMFIANNVNFNAESSFQIITGPNMGGKSTYIRQTAIVALMAQIGSFVPCSSATVPVFDSIMVRVGAGDSILRGISTFMMEMLETASILRNATRNTLVIIDELGRGTSTSEGLGIAWGVSEEIAKVGCFTFFATHFHELTELSKSVPNVRNMQATASVCDEKLVMTYRIVPGVCDQSFGIHVAEMARFPPTVVSIARIKTRELEGSGFEGEAEEDVDQGIAYLTRKLAGDPNDDFSDAPAFLRSILCSAI